MQKASVNLELLLKLTGPVLPLCLFGTLLTLTLFISRNKAIADYLSSNGYMNALGEFQKETSMVMYKAGQMSLEKTRPCYH